jgi:hypothetical protein
LSGQLVYHDPGATAYQQLHRTRELKSLRHRARLLCFHLVDPITSEVLDAVREKQVTGRWLGTS